jgi:hypothetical protein
LIRKKISLARVERDRDPEESGAPQSPALAPDSISSVGMKKWYGWLSGSSGWRTGFMNSFRISVAACGRVSFAGALADTLLVNIMIGQPAGGLRSSPVSLMGDRVAAVIANAKRRTGRFIADLQLENTRRARRKRVTQIAMLGLLSVLGLWRLLPRRRF